MKIIPLPYKIIGIVLITLGVFGYGFMKGSSAANSKFEKARLSLQQELFDLSDDLSVKNAQILQLAKEREDLIHDLETQALTAPGSSNPGIAATGGLQRLNSRWGRKAQ